MPEALTIHLNGVTRTFDELGSPTSVATLVEALQFRADRVALERNGDIVSRTTWTEATVQSGDRIEIVHFVGGG